MPKKHRVKRQKYVDFLRECEKKRDEYLEKRKGCKRSRDEQMLSEEELAGSTRPFESRTKRIRREEAMAEEQDRARTEEEERGDVPTKDVDKKPVPSGPEEESVTAAPIGKKKTLKRKY